MLLKLTFREDIPADDEENVMAWSSACKIFPSYFVNILHPIGKS